MLRDLRYALRMLVKSPGFALAAVLTLALGIGANTAIFSVVNAVLLRPLPYREAGRLAMIWSEFPGRGWIQNAIYPGDYQDWKDQNRWFEGMAAFQDRSFNLTRENLPAEEVPGERVTASFFSVLRASAMLGRTFTEEEDRARAPRVAVLSNACWRERYAGDPLVIGKTMALNSETYTIVGVMPPEFQFPPFGARKSELWTPLGAVSRNRSLHELYCLVRLNNGVPLADAQARMSVVNSRLVRENPSTNTGWTARVQPLRDIAAGSEKPALMVLTWAVGFVLLIACANIANLLLARSTGRRKEIAVRLALGAGRRRILAQFLTESLLLALAAAALGLLLAAWGMSGLVALAPADTPGVASASIDGRVLAFTILIAVLTGVIFGIAPALGAAALDVNQNLKEGGRGSTSGRRRQSLRSALVVSEFALALVLLIGAGLLIRSFVRVVRIDPGFDPKNVLTMRIRPSGQRYDDDRAYYTFFRNLLPRVRALPGVEQAGIGTALPLIDWNGWGFVTEKNPNVPLSEGPDGNYQAISPDFFRALKIPLRRGRFFDDGDREDTAPVAIINEESAREFWPGENPVGTRIRIGGEGDRPRWRTIVGVVGNVRRNDLTDAARPETYVPYTQPPLAVRPREMLIRTAGDPARIAQSVRREAAALDKDQPVADIQTLESVVGTVLSPRVFSTALLGIFASLALALAAVGIFSVMAYSVAQRTHEIGIRVALGARRGAVMRLVVGHGLKLAVAGIVAGGAASLALTRLLADFLYDIRPTDPATFAGVALLLIAVALGASYLPAKRAMSVDPATALRDE
ncbi:MAG TPA: ABC transporter permease [Bryobacteraceae bacterium]|nr:ABC transporter permease [Bryobacteraceae bacterium]